MEEMENAGGKRVLPGKKLPLGAKIGLIAVAALLALAVGGYLGLCGYVSGSGKILPNTKAEGVSLGGLSRAGAEELVAGASRYGGQTLVFDTPNGEARVPGSVVAVDAAAAADAAYRLGRENGFLGGGWAYLTAFFGGSYVEVPVRFSPEGERQVDDIVAGIEDHLTQRMEETAYRVDGETLRLVKGVSGMSIDGESLKAAILQGFREGKGASGESAFRVEAQITPPPEPDFDAIYAEVRVEKADAYLDKDTKEIVPSVTGVSFDIATAQALLERTGEGAVCRVPLTKTEPDMTTEKLEANLFKDLLAGTKTHAAGPSARWHNIKLACSFINDTILLPGEEFSYNAACEPYTTSNGYKNAGTYQNGKSVDATAGGICQLSSTLYWATLEANLETVERRQHGMNGGYMPIVGTDATVFSGAPDFKFKNNTEYPVKLEAYMDNNANVYVNIYGTSNGLHGEPFNKVLSSKAAQTVYKPNEAVPQGSEPQKDPEQYALSGVTVEVYLRVVNEAGETVETRFLHKDSYAKRDAVYYYNPADAALWGIDPATGLKTLAPVTPTPSPDPNASPDPNVSPDPNASPDPGVSPDPDASPSPDPGPETPAPSPDPSEAPVETPPPGIPLETPGPSPTPPVEPDSGAADAQPPADPAAEPAA